MPQSVCIIGAGPSGLAAAKTLAHHHLHLTPPAPGPLFTATVYDSHHSPGGQWPLSPSDPDRPIHPHMTTNLSRHTVQFSDLAWDPSLPEFPRAWMVGRYLARYARTYLHARENVDLRFGRRVVSAERRAGGRGGWVVESEAVGGGGRERREYDLLVVASGYFGSKRVPAWAGAGLDTGGRDIPVVHSSEFRDLEGLLASSRDGPGRKILVVGGQMSGVEIASTIAAELSSAVHSPGPSPIRDVAKYTVHHLCERQTWVMPLFTTPTPTKKAPYFLPSDLNAFNLATRPQPMTNLRGGLIPEDAARAAHKRIETSLGTDQSEFHPLMVIDDPSSPPYVAISQLYPNLVRAGLITPSRGRLASLQDIPAQTGISSLDDVAAVVLATGFDPSPSLSFLDPDVLEAIGHAPEFPELTPALAFHGTHHPGVPDLGFAGFYRAPYWGVAEMQSRLLAHLWTPEAVSPRADALKRALEEDRSVEEVLAMRGSLRTSQFPMGDYAFLMQEFARALGLEISPHTLAATPSPDVGPMDILTPARYSYPAAPPPSRAETEASLGQTRDCAEACLGSARFLAASVFRNLLGEWDLRREITSQLPSHPSGTFSGTARFSLRRKTSDGLSRSSEGDDAPAPAPDGGEGGKGGKGEEPFDGAAEGWEYLYVEEGTFTASGGFSFPAKRSYVYRYDEAADRLSVWFVKVEDAERADYLFHEVEFLPPSSSPGVGGGKVVGKGGARAKAGHLCIEDYYAVDYDFDFEGVVLRGWGLGYEVRGPKKAYRLVGRYTRPE